TYQPSARTVPQAPRVVAEIPKLPAVPRKRRMLKFIAKRFVSYVAMLFIAMTLVYFVASWFLNPRSNYLSMRPVPPESAIDASLSYANINDKVPIIVRYWHWLQDVVLHWNWGYSPQGEAINNQLWERAWVSLQVAGPPVIFAIVLGVALGVYTAIRQYRRRSEEHTSELQSRFDL